MHKEFLRENHLEIYQMQEEEGKMLLREIGCEDLYWMQLAQDCVK
jgi:hypothetical protein